MKDTQLEATKNIQLTIDELENGCVYYTPDKLNGTGGEKHNIFTFDERVHYLEDFGHNPRFYKIQTSFDRDKKIDRLRELLKIVLESWEKCATDDEKHGIYKSDQFKIFKEIETLKTKKAE